MKERVLNKSINLACMPTNKTDTMNVFLNLIKVSELLGQEIPWASNQMLKRKQRSDVV